MKLFTIFAAIAASISTVASLATPPPPPGELIPAADVTIVKSDDVVNITSRGPGFAHGRCSYHVVAHQYCNRGNLRTLIKIPTIMDNNHEVMVSPYGGSDHDWKELTPGWPHNVWQIPTPFYDFWVSMWTKPDRLEWSYGMCHWQSWSATQDPTKDCGDCRVGA